MWAQTLEPLYTWGSSGDPSNNISCVCTFGRLITYRIAVVVAAAAVVVVAAFVVAAVVVVVVLETTVTSPQRLARLVRGAAVVAGL